MFAWAVKYESVGWKISVGLEIESGNWRHGLGRGGLKGMACFVYRAAEN